MTYNKIAEVLTESKYLLNQPIEVLVGLFKREQKQIEQIIVGIRAVRPRQSKDEMIANTAVRIYRKTDTLEEAQKRVERELTIAVANSTFENIYKGIRYAKI